MKKYRGNALGGLLAASIFALLASMAGDWQGHKRGTHEMQSQAVAKGHAEWIVKNDGTATFQWK